MRTMHLRYDPREPAPDWTIAVAGRVAATTDEQLEEVGSELGVSLRSLRRLDVFWSGRWRAWGFPMRRPNGQVTGIRVRCRGRKWSAPGGREALFLPDDVRGKIPLLICEGPTDTAALLDLGFAAVGRPSCRGSVRHACEFVRGLNYVAIVADQDDAGRRGAFEFAEVAALYAKDVCVVLPPPDCKDAREWAQKGNRVDVYLEIVEAIGMAARWPARFDLRGEERVGLAH